VLVGLRVFVDPHVHDVAPPQRADHRLLASPRECARRQRQRVLIDAHGDALRIDRQHDRRIKLVDCVRLIAPGRIPIRQRIESFGDQIARRFAEAAAMIERAQAALQR